MLQYLTWCQDEETMNSKSSDKKASVYEKKCLHGRCFTLGPACFFGSVRQSNRQILPLPPSLVVFSFFLVLSMRPLMNFCFLLTCTLLHVHVDSFWFRMHLLLNCFCQMAFLPTAGSSLSDQATWQALSISTTATSKIISWDKKTIGRFNRRTKIPYPQVIKET